jgi:hypothetical protein
MASLPDFLLRDKKQFLDIMAAPRPFTELKADEVRIRLLGDFAIIHTHELANGRWCTTSGAIH